MHHASASGRIAKAQFTPLPAQRDIEFIGPLLAMISMDESLREHSRQPAELMASLVKLAPLAPLRGEGSGVRG
jgi:hypothetical protein